MYHDKEFSEQEVLMLIGYISTQPGLENVQVPVLAEYAKDGLQIIREKRNDNNSS